MMADLSIFHEDPVFSYFYRMNQVPRCSDDVDRVAVFLEEIGKEHNLFTEKDEFGNVRIIKPATPGAESAPRVIIQGHMDMVCVKTEDSSHDFTCEPIEMVEEDGWLKAVGTTLGGDDGIGVAMGLALLDEEGPMPEIQVLATTNEETGMDGAIGLSPKWLEAEMLVNIDSEEDFAVTSGCAGGATGDFKMPILRQEVADHAVFSIQIKGMKGGHSGMSILEVPNNAAKVMAEWIRLANKKASFALVDFTSGEKHNAIPNAAQATLSFLQDEKESVEKALRQSWEEILGRILKQEPDIMMSITEGTTDKAPLDAASMQNFLSLIEIVPHGVYKMRPNGEGVQTSDNLAVVKLEETQAFFMVSVRSGSIENLDILRNEIVSAMERFEAVGNFYDGYPAWEFEEESPLRELFVRCYEEANGKKPEILDIHAGLECGLFAQKNPDLDMISIGPNLEGVHTPLERLEIASAKRTYVLLKNLIHAIATDGAKRYNEEEV